jgi:hypothetical protein
MKDIPVLMVVSFLVFAILLGVNLPSWLFWITMGGHTDGDHLGYDRLELVHGSLGVSITEGIESSTYEPNGQHGSACSRSPDCT